MNHKKFESNHRCSVSSTNQQVILNPYHGPFMVLTHFIHQPSNVKNYSIGHIRQKSVNPNKGSSEFFLHLSVNVWLKIQNRLSRAHWAAPMHTFLMQYLDNKCV